MVVITAVAAGAAVVARRAHAGIGHDVLVGTGIGIHEGEAPLRNATTAECQPGAGNREARLLAIARIHRVLFGPAGPQEQRVAVATGAPGQVHALLGAVALGVFAVVHRHLRAVEFAAGDDVDHTGDCVGAV
ncbi:hypothetical protein D3C71_1624550 [compost metagenome]